MKKIFGFLVLGLLMLSSCIKRDNNTIRGTVTFVGKIDGIEYYANSARVMVVRSFNNTVIMDTFTDNMGNYDLFPVPDGSYYLLCTFSTTFYNYQGQSETFFIEKESVRKVNVVMW